MTDAQIIKCLAEKVMGWHFVRSNEFGDAICHDRWNTWNPLVSDTDACSVLDKMAEDWSYTIDSVIAISSFQPGVCVTFDQSVFPPSHSKTSGLPSYIDISRRRAICIAALKAVGAWE